MGSLPVILLGLILIFYYFLVLPISLLICYLKAIMAFKVVIVLFVEFAVQYAADDDDVDKNMYKVYIAVGGHALQLEKRTCWTSLGAFFKLPLKTFS